MASRREFLGAMGIALYGGTEVAGNLRPRSVDEGRRFLATSVPVSPAPPRTGIIDWHAHWIGPHVIELLEKRGNPRPPAGAGWTDVDARLREMDRAHVERQVLSYIGASYDNVIPPDEAKPFWRAQNDDLAALIKKHPSRFSALASIPTARVAWAAEELDRAHAQLGLLGATLPLDAFVSLAGAKALAPIFDVAQKHRSHIIVHRGAAAPEIPGQQPEAGPTDAYLGLSRPQRGAPVQRDGGRGEPPSPQRSQGTEVPGDLRPDLPARTSPQRSQGTEVPGDLRPDLPARTALITASHLATGVITLVLTDFLDPYPDVTVQVAMIGGAFAFVAEQIQMAAEESGQPVPAQRFKRVYVDTGNAGRGPRGVTLAAQVFGADRVLFGTDSGPVATIMPTVESVSQATLTKAELDLIFSGNGRRLLDPRPTPR